jgi:hypothetical protein
MLLAFLSIKTCFITLPEAFLGNGASIISHVDGTLNFARLSSRYFSSSEVLTSALILINALTC